jgi:hypothetical protein
LPQIVMQITEADFIASQRAWLKSRPWPRLSFGLGVVLAALSLLLGAIDVAYGHGRETLDFLPFALVAAVWLWVGWSMMWGTPWGARRLYRQSGQFHQPVTCEWDDEGFRVTGPDVWQRFRWSDFRSWAEDRRTLVLGVTYRSFFPIPKRLASAEALADLRGRLQRRERR